MGFSHRIRNCTYSAIKYAINMLIFVRQDLQDSLDFFLSFHLPAIGFAFRRVSDSPEFRNSETGTRKRAGPPAIAHSRPVRN